MLVAIAVAIASGIGGLARYGISNLVHGDDLPWATLAINVAGSFLLGALIVVPAASMSEQARTALGVGFLGGFTTFSTFSVQAFLDFEAGEPARAALYISASVMLGLAAAAAGYYSGRALIH
jgi:fluoride exporter